MRAARRSRWFAGAAAVAVALLAAAGVLRNAAVRSSPALAQRLWPGHPEPLTALAMARVGADARKGEPLGKEAEAELMAVARKSPLAAEPFLVEGAAAQVAGQADRAERLFLAARLRDPRSPATRYFLADQYLRTGRVDAGLAEMAGFARMVGGPQAAGPALAAFARTTGAVAPLRKFFDKEPAFEPIVLQQLAADGAEPALILRLASRPDARWAEPLIARLVENERFAEARRVWNDLTKAGADGSGLFNAAFDEIDAPPPFNWRLATGGALVEPQGGGRLHVIYYGRDDTVLAEQLLMLAPGRYALRARLSGRLPDGTAIGWTLSCAAKGATLAAIPVPTEESSADVGGNFTVPGGCPAQWLRLNAQAPDIARSIDFILSRLTLTRTGR